VRFDVLTVVEYDISPKHTVFILFPEDGSISVFLRRWHLPASLHGVKTPENDNIAVTDSAMKIFCRDLRQ
jgi:hypothetical protein